MEEMTYYDYLPGGRGHKRWEQFLCEFRRALAETIGTFVLVLTVCLGSASPHTSQPRASTHAPLSLSLSRL
jgi:glycerol uptake facilitator-like aquaporin